MENSQNQPRKQNTIYLKTLEERKEQVQQVISDVCDALVEKKYDPVNQLVGYILSGDPVYITGHKNARAKICQLERDELVAVLVDYYLENNPGMYN